MNGIKFTSGAINKRVNEPVESFLKLVEVIKQVFNYTGSNISVFYIDTDGDKIEISTEEEFFKIASYHKAKVDSVVKLEVTFDVKKIICSDSLLDNLKISESFAIYEKNDKNDIVHEFKKNATVQTIKDDSLAVSEVKSDKKYEEKAIQNKEDNENKFTETVIHTSSLGTNTLLVSNAEKEVQVDKKNKDMIVNQIDDMLASRLKLMESKMESRFESMLRMLEGNNSVNKENGSVNNINPNTNKIEHQLEYESQIEIISEKKPIDDPAFISLMGNPNEFFAEEFCSHCKFQILQNKYICILCEDYKLCTRCEKTHIYHPLMKVNINTKSITTKEELIKHILTQYGVNEKKGIIKSLKNIFTNDTIMIHLSPNFCPLKFAMPAGEKYVYNILVQNAGKNAINEPITITAVNNKNFTVANDKIISSLNVLESQEAEFLFEAPNELGVYSFELNVFLKEKNCKIEPVRLEIHVVEKEQVSIKNADLYFSEYEEVLELADDKKVLLYKLIDEKISQLTIPEVIEIMKKHDFDLMSALDELTTKQEEGECYYDGSNNLLNL